MPASLSILLPVHNDQARLEARVHELLDILPELTARFDILVVDDGSTDATCEIAAELESRYPQLRLLRSGSRRGMTEALQTALDQTTGDVVFICDDEHGMDAEEIARLWHLRHDIEREQPVAADLRPHVKLAPMKQAGGRRLPTAKAGDRVDIAARLGAEHRRTDAGGARVPAGKRGYLDGIKKFALGE